ncbi:MAG: hypothetical protein RLZZ584_504 [Pseudomonadota bacterium]
MIAGPPATLPATLVVAGLSVRGLAVSARRAGWRVLALDVFGDQDTRRACAAWWPIGAPHEAAPRIDPAGLLAALDAARVAVPAGSRLLGCVTGSGFEPGPALLDAIARRLPLLGLGAAAVALLRDPAHCHASAAALGIAQPGFSLTPPDGPGWLVKDMASSGGQGVRRWVPGGPARSAASTSSSVYWQRETAGLAVGTLVLADGCTARLIGVHEQLVDPTPERPWRFAGVVAPLPLTAPQAGSLQQALAGLVRVHGLRGLVSVDWLLADGHWQLLEINPRPSASLAVHERLQARAWPHGLLAAHVAMFDAGAPAVPTPAAPGARAVGELVVHAPHDLALDASTLARWAARADVHDIPALPGPGVRQIHLPAGAPLCSVSACGATPGAVKLALQQRRRALLAALPSLQPDTPATSACPT